MKGSVHRLLLCLPVLATALVVAASATAANGPLPWEGGFEAMSELEARASTTLTEAAKRQVYVICASPEEWVQIGSAQSFDPNLVYGITPFDESGPLDFTVVSPQACFSVSEWVYAPDRRAQKWCVTGTKTEYRTEYTTETRTEYRTEYRMQTRTVSKRKKVNGRWKTVRVRVSKRVAVRVPHRTTRQVPHQVPYEVKVEAICPDYVVPKLFGWQTIIHEGVHLIGVMDEAQTDCFAMQNLPWFANRMGLDAAQAREIGVDYWTMYYVPHRPATPEYFSAECRDGGALDLRPESHDWPLARLAPKPSGAVRAGFAGLLSRPTPHTSTSL